MSALKRYGSGIQRAHSYSGQLMRLENELLGMNDKEQHTTQKRQNGVGEQDDDDLFSDPYGDANSSSQQSGENGCRNEDVRGEEDEDLPATQDPFAIDDDDDDDDDDDQVVTEIARAKKASSSSSSSSSLLASRPQTPPTGVHVFTPISPSQLHASPNEKKGKEGQPLAKRTISLSLSPVRSTLKRSASAVGMRSPLSGSPAKRKMPSRARPAQRELQLSQPPLVDPFEGSQDQPELKTTEKHATTTDVEKPKPFLLCSPSSSSSQSKSKLDHKKKKSNQNFLLQDSHGENRALLDELQFLVEGMDEHQSVAVKAKSALLLASKVSGSDETCFALRSNGGFEHICSSINTVLDQATTNPTLAKDQQQVLQFLMYVGVSILNMACGDIRNLSDFGEPGVRLLLFASCTEDFTPEARGGDAKQVLAKARKSRSRSRSRMRRSHSGDVGSSAAAKGSRVSPLRDPHNNSNNNNNSDYEKVDKLIVLSAPHNSGLDGVIQASSSLINISKNNISTGSHGRDRGTTPVFALALCALEASSEDPSFATALTLTSGGIENLLWAVYRDFTYLNSNSQQPNQTKAAQTVFRSFRLRRMLAVLENLTHVSIDNPQHFLRVKLSPTVNLGSILRTMADTSLQILRRPSKDDTQTMQKTEASKWLVQSCRLLVNLTHKNDAGIDAVLSSSNGLETFFEAIVFHEVVKKEWGDVGTLCMGLLINCCEFRKTCCDSLLRYRSTDIQQSVLEFLVAFFLRYNKQQEDAEKKQKEKKTQKPEEDESLMEAQVKASYSAVLIGVLLSSSKDLREQVQKMLPGGTFASLVSVLSDLVLLQSNANMLTKDSLDSTLSIIALLKNHDEALRRHHHHHH